jgi:hypothetical protein
VVAGVILADVGGELLGDPAAAQQPVGASTPPSSHGCSPSRPSASPEPSCRSLSAETDTVLAAPDRDRGSGRRDHALHIADEYYLGEGKQDLLGADRGRGRALAARGGPAHVRPGLRRRGGAGGAGRDRPRPAPALCQPREAGLLGEPVPGQQHQRQKAQVRPHRGRRGFTPAAPSPSPSARGGRLTTRRLTCSPYSSQPRSRRRFRYPGPPAGQTSVITTRSPPNRPGSAAARPPGTQLSCQAERGVGGVDQVVVGALPIPHLTAGIPRIGQDRGHGAQRPRCPGAVRVPFRVSGRRAENARVVERAGDPGDAVSASRWANTPCTEARGSPILGCASMGPRTVRATPGSLKRGFPWLP